MLTAPLGHEVSCPVSHLTKLTLTITYMLTCFTLLPWLFWMCQGDLERWGDMTHIRRISALKTSMRFPGELRTFATPLKAAPKTTCKKCFFKKLFALMWAVPMKSFPKFKTFSWSTSLWPFGCPEKWQKKQVWVIFSSSISLQFSCDFHPIWALWHWSKIDKQKIRTKEIFSPITALTHESK